MDTVTLSRPVRAARVTLGVALAVGLGGAGHLLAGGRASWSGVLFAAVLLAGPMWLAGRRELTWPVLAVLLSLGQLVVHVAFLGVGSHDPDVHSGPSAWLMWAAHAAAGALLAVWLRVGERRLWRAARRCLDVLTTWLPEPVVVVCPAGSTDPAVGVSALLRHCIVLRGPPAAS
ncbi:hypothetical protein GCM10023148_47710 [Actinokineospora soli]